MAKVIGSEAGGYATVAPTENYIGQALQNVEQNAFKYREEERQEQAKKAALAKAKQDALDKERDDEANDLEKLGAIRAKDSGISGIDSAISNGMSSLREKYINYKRSYRKTGDKNDLLKMSSALNQLHGLSTLPDSYKKVVDNVRDMYDKGEIDKSEVDRLTELGDKIEKGFIVPKIENGTMSFDVYGRDAETGQLSSLDIKNMKGEELLNQLTPQKKFDKLKDIQEVAEGYGKPVTNFNKQKNSNVTEVPDLENKIKNSVNLLFKDEGKLQKYAKAYGINKAVKDLTQEEQTAIANQYTTDLRANFNKGEVPNMVLRDQALQEENDRLKKVADAKKVKVKAFTPPVDIETKGGMNSELGINTAKGDKILGPTYEKGKSGPVQGVVLKPNGTYSFSIAERKDKKLNAEGLANEKEFRENPDNEGEDYEPLESDYKFSKSKPTEFTSAKNSNVLSKYVRTMLNPATGEYFQNFKEYKQYYDKFKPAATASKPKQNYRNPIEAGLNPDNAFTRQAKATKKAPAFDAEAYYKNYKAKK